MNRLPTATLLASVALAPSLALAQDRFVAPLPAPAEVEVKANVAYKTSGERSLSFDLYRPIKRTDSIPIVIFVNGIGADWMRGHVQYSSWGRAVTARGLAGVTMDSREASVDEDVKGLIAYLTQHAAELGIDPTRIALWSCSANVPRGLALAQSIGPPVRSAVVYYGTATGITFRRVLPVLFVRAGQDGVTLNKGLEALVSKGMAENAPIEMINVASGVHGFDVRDDTEISRAVIARTLDFLSATLSPSFGQAIKDGELLASTSAAVYREDWRAAVAGYEALNRAKPQDPLIWQRLGEARRATGDSAGALTAFEKALEIGSPNHGIVSFAVATLHAQAGRIDQAFAALEGMKPQLRFFLERLRTDPVFETLRKDSRYAELIRAVPEPPL